MQSSGQPKSNTTAVLGMIGTSIACAPINHPEFEGIPIPPHSHMHVDWSALFALSVAPLELIVRGSIIYWFLFLVFRLVLRRDVGSIGIADILLLVLVADAAQNAMAAEYRSITDGLILISTIIGWNLVLDWIAYRSPPVRRLLQPPALILVRNGSILHRNLRRELMTVDDLMAKLREHGVDQIGMVRAAYMEGDGTISVIKRKD